MIVIVNIINFHVKTYTFKEELKLIMQCQKDLLNVILELKKVKVEKNEIEPYVFKVSEEISNNSTLKSYYNALYGKLHSAMTGADTIASGQLASDTSDI